jgi:hypothetical protein
MIRRAAARRHRFFPKEALADGERSTPGRAGFPALARAAGRHGASRMRRWLRAAVASSTPGSYREVSIPR